MRKYKASLFESNMLYPIFKYFAGWMMGILSYEALLEVCIFCFVFLIIGWINYSPGTPILIPMFNWFRFEGSYSYNTADIKSFLTNVISILTILGAVLHFFIHTLLKIKLTINSWWGLGTIIVFFIFSLISCFASTAKKGAQSIIPVAVFFLIFSLFSYGRYLFFRRLEKWLKH